MSARVELGMAAGSAYAERTTQGTNGVKHYFCQVVVRPDALPQLAWMSPPDGSVEQKALSRRGSASRGLGGESDGLNLSGREDLGIA
jgi:hypothetical protein